MGAGGFWKEPCALSDTKLELKLLLQLMIFRVLNSMSAQIQCKFFLLYNTRPSLLGGSSV